MDVPISTAFRILSLQMPGADTVVMVVARDGLETASTWATIVVGAFFVLLLPVLLLLFAQLRKVNRTVKELGERGLRRAEPIVESGKSIAENVEFVTLAVRTDVQRLNAAVKSLTDRLQQASDRMEERIEEFNALMEVVQSEAEEIFVGTAATVRGVRAGARSLGEGAAPDEDRPAGREEEIRRVEPGTGDESGEVYLTRPRDAPDLARRGGD